MSNLFEDHYTASRPVKIKKIISIYGEEFFRGKTILELGAGWGHTGREFQKLGAIVTFADGRLEHCNNIKRIDPNSEVLNIDNDKPWTIIDETTSTIRHFDIIIHWGLLYHLDHWQQDLECALKHTDLLFLESEVSDSDDPEFEIKHTERGHDQALNEIGTYSSPARIEQCLTQLGAAFTRYDDSDLTIYYNGNIMYQYDWPINNTNQWVTVQRKFWIANKS